MLIIIFFFLSFISLMETQRYGKEEFGEITNGAPIYKITDNIFVHFIAIIFLLAILFLLKRFFDKKSAVAIFICNNIKLIQKVIAVLAGVLSFLIFLGGTRTPNADQIQVYSAAMLFNEGNYVNLTKGGYVNMYPQQLGYILYMQIILKLVGSFGFQAIQIINCFLIMGTVYCACLLLNDLTNQPTPRIMGSLLLLFLLPLQLLNSWVYGDIPSFFFMFLFLHNFILASRNGRKINIIATIVSATCCLIFRKHALILLVAVLLVSFVSFLEKRYKRYLLIGLLTCIIPICTVSLIEKYYSEVSGYEVDGGIPSIAWITMGTIEGESKPGWFNNFCVPLYYSTDCNQSLTTQLSVERLEQQLAYFKEHPIYALSFYKRKICTQWNDPFFNTNSLIRVDDNTPSGLSSLLLKQENTTRMLLSLLQSIIYLGVLAYLVLVSYKGDFGETLPEMTILGGFLFSILWEANSRYVFPYYIIMFPLAAIGWYQLLNHKKFIK